MPARQEPAAQQTELNDLHSDMTPGLSTLEVASGGFFVPLDKGDAAFPATGGLEFIAEDSLWSKGGQTLNARSKVWRSQTSQ